MSPWVKKVFIDIMPVILCMQRPNYVPRFKSTSNCSCGLWTDVTIYVHIDYAGIPWSYRRNCRTRKRMRTTNTDAARRTCEKAKLCVAILRFK
jgi:hypothetical protein